VLLQIPDADRASLLADLDALRAELTQLRTDRSGETRH
jgi:hypothetical protein